MITQEIKKLTLSHFHCFVVLSTALNWGSKTSIILHFDIVFRLAIISAVKNSIIEENCSWGIIHGVHSTGSTRQYKTVRYRKAIVSHLPTSSPTVNHDPLRANGRKPKISYARNNFHIIRKLTLASQRIMVATWKFCL